MIHFAPSPLEMRVASALLHFLWQGALLWILAWGVLGMLARQRAQLRYWVACGFLALCLVLPICTLRYQNVPEPTRVVHEVGAPLPKKIALTGESLMATPPVLAQLHTHGSLATRFRKGINASLPWVFSAWMAGVILLALRVTGSWVWLQRVKTTALPVPEDWTERLKQFARTCGVSRTVRFLVSPRVQSPFTSGILRPFVMLPIGFFAHLDPVAVEAVIAHELAHIRRFDVLVNAFQCLVEVLFFFHPFVWWISRRIRNERENCCDDDAVLACGDPVLLAETLSRLDALHGRFLHPAPGAAGGNLVKRIHRLISKDPRNYRGALMGLFLSLLVLSGTTAVIAAQSQTSVATTTPDFQSVTRDGYTMNLIKTPDLPQVTVDRLFECFFATYPKMAARFNPDAPKNVTIVMEPFSPGVGRSFGSANIRWLSSQWLEEHPDDIDILTYHVFSIILENPVEKGFPEWLAKGLGNYVRDRYAVFDEKGSMLEMPGKDQDYKTLLYGISFGISGRFLKWTEVKVNPNILDELARNLRKGTYTEAFWEQQTGKTLDQLWAQYTADPSL